MPGRQANQPWPADHRANCLSCPRRHCQPAGIWQISSCYPYPIGRITASNGPAPNPAKPPRLLRSLN